MVVENPRKRKSNASPVKEKKGKKVKKLILNYEDVTSTTAPSHEESQGEVEKRKDHVGGAHEGEQAKGVAQDPPHKAQASADVATASGEGGDVMEKVVNVANAAAVREEVETTDDAPIIIDDPINIDEEIQRIAGSLGS
ncbi:hypothetical protein Dimus_017789 [Dionaea muscipula]